MPEAISKERHQAILVRDALHRIIAKLDQGKKTTPSELSCFVGKSAQKTTYLFHWMVCSAVAEKYQRADKTDIAAHALHLRQIVEWAYSLPARSMKDVEEIWGAARMLQALYHGTKRVSIHASRRKCADLDIMLCAGLSFGAQYGITPWVCQQEDCRYRWTEGGMCRLRYLARCWDVYASRELRWEDRMVGLSDFPTYPAYC